MGHWDEPGRRRVEVEHLDQVERVVLVVVVPLKLVEQAEGVEAVDLKEGRVECVN